MEITDLNDQVDQNYIAKQILGIGNEDVINPAWYQTVTNPQIIYPYPQNQLTGFGIYNS